MCHIKTVWVCIGWKLFKKSNNFNLYMYAKKSRITI
ncbi:hypothetical protein EUBDOL_00797 [Amedibacillus dolichus DSM 3991]|uniref:Uncharacterized protein n=1 Tax=Amedibacillus dolichus DSM 3991 TaxID=428127 RepID=A8RAF6_9FIRM|nr:hypothetical protein EUBDOL_00797 [Amedibacillus dolichus DSM 3991]